MKQPTNASPDRLQHGYAAALCYFLCYHEFGFLQSRRQVSQAVREYPIKGDNNIIVIYFGISQP